MNTEPQTPLALDLTQARPMSGADLANQFTELCLLRPTITRLMRQEFELRRDLENELKESQRSALKQLQALVAVVDEFRLMQIEIAQHLKASGDKQPEASAGGLLKGMFGRAKKATDGVEAEWLGALLRLWKSARGDLEGVGIHHVPLLGHDLREVRFEDQPIKQFVAVKNTPPAGGQLVVNKEIRGLWVIHKKDQLTVLQRGEVTVG